jgi:apolipoprotein N-acyltransferase
MIVSAAAGACGGLLLALSFPVHNLDILAWIAFVPLFWGIRRAETPSKAAIAGLFFGWSFFLIDLSWIYDTLVVHGHFKQVTAVAMYIGMACILACVPALFGFVLAYASGSILTTAFLSPFLWVALEYGRSVIFGGFPWDLTGYSQIGRLTLIQVTDITGVYGISFMVLIVNAAIWTVLELVSSGEKISWTSAACAVILLVLVSAYGYKRMADYPEYEPESDSADIGILQGNIEQDVKWSHAGKEYAYAVYERYGSEAVKKGAQLLVWPETAVPAQFVLGNEAWKRTSGISERLGAPMLVGAPSMKVIKSKPHFFNSAFLVDGRNVDFQYNKIHLVPFGEYMPLNWLLPLGPGLATRKSDYTPGREMTIMRTKGVPLFAVLICYEAVFPELACRAVRNGAGMLVNITNDGWFGFSAAPYQHLNMARMRSVENRVWFLRSANTGVSAVFDPAGREVGRIGYGEEGVLLARVPKRWGGGSLYSRYGDIFAWMCIIASIVAIVTFRRHSGRNQPV